MHIAPINITIAIVFMIALISSEAFDLTNRKTFDSRVWSMIPMVWATVFIFKKNAYTNYIESCGCGVKNLRLNYNRYYYFV